VPGCESLTASGENAFDVAVNAAIGPVKARFKGKLALADVQAPESYALRFGHAGWRGGLLARRCACQARCRRCEHDADDLRRQRLDRRKIAQIGSRLVDAAAATMADRFFTTFAADLAAKYPPAAGAPTVPVAQAPGFFATLWAFLKRLFGSR